MDNRYSRCFVALKQEHSDYTVSGREATGKCIIERKNHKGKVMISVQNLKNETIYKPYLICTDGGRSMGVPVGNLTVDERGRGELKFECDALNVAGSGKELNEFKVVALVFIKPEGLVVPLVGYRDEEVSWKHNFALFEVNEGIHKEAIREETIPHKDEDPIDDCADHNGDWDGAEHSIDDKAIIEDEISSHSELDINEADLSSHEQNLSPPQQNNNVQEPVEVKFESIPEYNPNTKAKIWDFYENPWADPIHNNFRETVNAVHDKINQNSGYQFFKYESAVKSENKPEVHAVNSEVKSHKDIEFLLSKNTKMRPFAKQKKDVKWIRISMKELVYLPETKWAYMNEPFVISSYKKYNHLILGHYEENGVKELFLGVPDIYEQKNELIAKHAGFLQFKCCEEVEKKEGCHGYWLIDMVI